MLDILRLLNAFEKKAKLCKIASDIKVPEKFLKDATDWVIGCYAARLLQLFERKIKQNEKRVKISEKLGKKSEALNKFNGDLYYNGSEADIWDFVVTIPKFKIEEDEDSKLYGTVESDTCFSIFIDQEGDEIMITLSYDFDVPNPEHEYYEDKPERITINESHFKVFYSKEEAVEFLQSQAEKIDRVANFFEDFYHSYEVYGEGYKKQMFTVIGRLKKLASKAEGAKTFFEKLFVIDPSEVPYLRDNKKHIGVIVRFIYNEDIARSLSKEEFDGLWDKSVAYLDSPTGGEKILRIGSMYVYKDTDKEYEKVFNLDTLDKRLGDIKTTMRHETQHMMQDLITWVNLPKKKMLGDREIVGLPGEKVLDPRISEHGLPKEFWGYKWNIPEEMYKDDPYGRIRHELRDVEFYTRLSDCVDDFNNLKRRIPLQLHRDFALVYIDHIPKENFFAKLNSYIDKVYRDKEGNLTSNYWDAMQNNEAYAKESVYKIYNTFFRSLKKYQPEKYRKAVGSFMKMIGF